MEFFSRIACVVALIAYSYSLSAQNFKADRLQRAVNILGLQIEADSLMPEMTYGLTAKDGKTICLRTDPMGSIEHVGIPLFNEAMRLLQPSPVYDFLEFAVMNWKYKVNPNQLYLSKVIFRHGSWETLLREKMNECSCSIENRDDKLYIVSWQKDDRELACIGIPIEYELLNNDTRRNMERNFIKDLVDYHPTIERPKAKIVDEKELSIYGTEGLFVIPGKSYIIDLLNQNVYYKLTTVYEEVDTIVNKKNITMRMEAVQPVIIKDQEYPAETMANLMMGVDASVPDVMMELDFHLSNYHRQRVSIPLSQLKSFCHQQGCSFYFACDGVQGDNTRGVMFASNLPKGYNHLFSMRIPTDMLVSDEPIVQADVYLYIPPVNKEKLFGIAPTKKSNANFKLP